MSAIVVNLSPTIELGPVSIAWHGIMIAVGVLVGGLIARSFGKTRGLKPEEIEVLVVIMAVAGIVGARFYYLAQEDSAALIEPGEWFGNVGFAFYGAVILGTLATAAYIWRKRLSVAYLDALALGFPLGMAVGRLGDLINGEHYGPPTTAPWGFVYTNPASEVPNHDVAYQSGAFLEILLVLVMFAALWPPRHYLTRKPGLLLALTIALYAIGRFLIFFVIRDSPVVALGLRQAQWTSLGLLAASVAGAVVATKRAPGITLTTAR